MPEQKKTKEKMSMLCVKHSLNTNGKKRKLSAERETSKKVYIIVFKICGQSAWDCGVVDQNWVVM